LRKEKGKPEAVVNSCILPVNGLYPQGESIDVVYTWDELRYSLRSLEAFAPWVGNIYIVTNGDTPYWLDTSHSRILIITHDEIFLDRSYLPTFNSNAIELQLHRIPNLSRRFLYFNDDVFLGRAVSRGDFITESDGQYIYFQKKPFAE